MQIFFIVISELVFTAAKSRPVNVQGKHKWGQGDRENGEDGEDS
jgi:hypothetical protein